MYRLDDFDFATLRWLRLSGILAMLVSLLAIFATSAGAAAPADGLAANAQVKQKTSKDNIQLAQRRRRGPNNYGGRGRRRGGIGGAGLAIGIGALIIQQGLNEDRRRRDSDRTERKTRRDRRRVRIVCRNGFVRGRTCVCRSGRTRTQIRRRVFACKRKVAVPTADPKSPRRCKRGAYSKRRCSCVSSRWVRRRVKGRGYTCVRVAKPGKKSDPTSGGKKTAQPGKSKPRRQPPRRVAPPKRKIVGRFIPRIVAGAVVPDFVPDEVVIRVPRSAPRTLESNIAGTHNLTILQRQESTLLDERLIRMRIKPTENVPAKVEQLLKDPRVLGAQPNYIYQKPKEATAKSNNNLQYALSKLGVADENASPNGQGILIAVVDSGVDGAHPDLTGAITKSYNAIGDKVAKPDNHGTAVAGIIAGRGLVRGVAPGAKLLDIRAFKATVKGGPRLATTFVLQRGMDWAMSERARILNLSFAGPADPLLRKAVQSASRKGALMVAAAGNEGAKAKPAYPAAYKDVIAVTATDTSDKLYEKANQGDYITLAAPGVEILAPSTGKAHDMHTGTSFAAAHVSGILALMLQRAPNLSSTDALTILVGGARDLGPPGRDDQFGAGGANAGAALRRLSKGVAAK